MGLPFLKKKQKTFRQRVKRNRKKAIVISKTRAASTINVIDKHSRNRT